MTKTKPFLSIIAAAMMAGFGAPASAGFFTTTITPGFNNYKDESLEAYVDVNQDGLFSAGDVLVGLARLDDKTSAPNPQQLNNTTYAIFSQQVDTIVGNVVNFKPTTTAGLTLAALGVVGAGASDMIAIFSSGAGGYATNLITTSPGNVGTGGAVTLKDYFNFIIAGGTLDMIMGMADAPFCTGGTSDCFQANSVFAGGPNSVFTTLGTGVSIGSFVAGLEVSTDPAGFTILDNTVAGAFVNPGVFVTLAEVALSAGSVTGAVGATNAAEWTNASELTALPQCTADNGPVACGFTDKTDFTFNAAAIPEPATVGLLGIGLLGLFAARRRRV